ncbi:hypothetical protein GW17_00027772 [Ensete ventricosum]|nr:hypothetical protein GW17_00027772 [Ensete ventricosum]
MRLGTRLECVGSSPRVLEACQDGARDLSEEAKTRQKIIKGSRKACRELEKFSSGLVGHDCNHSLHHAGLTMTEAIELQLDDGPRSSLGITPGSDDAVGPRREFARRFAEGIGKLARNTPRDRRKKTIGLIARMSEAAGLARVRS